MPPGLSAALPYDRLLSLASYNALVARPLRPAVDEVADDSPELEEAEPQPLRFGKEGAGRSSNSPNFKEASRPPPGIARHQFVIPVWAQEQLDQQVAAFNAAKASNAAGRNKALKAAITPAVHVMAACAINELGVNPAKAV